MTYVIAVCVAFGLWLFVVRSAPDLFPTKWQFKGLDRFSCLLLGLVWSAYGLLHLLHPSGSLNEMPAFLGSVRQVLFAASGALEIALGLLVISVKFRRSILLLQLWLVVALTPFVVFLLVNDGAVVDLLGSALPLGVCRFIVVLHNLLLFAWIYREYERAAVSTRRPSTRTPSTHRRLAPVTIVAVTMLTANIAGFLVVAAGPWDSGLPQLWAMGFLASGALIGFIFGVPRWVQPAGAVERARYEPNTNIEQLSDWLTKILVGVGLVEIHEVGQVVGKIADVFARGAAPRPGRSGTIEEARAFATGVVVYFSTAGIIQGFLLTRMFLARAWQPDPSPSEAMQVRRDNPAESK